MPYRKYVTDKAELFSGVRKILSSSEEARFIHKVECVNFVLAGMTPEDVSKYVLESRSTIAGWVKTVCEEGFEALRSKKQTGRTTELSK